MSRENPLWGAPHIHGELLKLGVEIIETSVPGLPEGSGALSVPFVAYAAYTGLRCHWFEPKCWLLVG
jgi:hypothetical protein